MSVAELQKYTIVSRYARWDENKQRRETWEEATERVRQMMRTKYASLCHTDEEFSQKIDWAYDLIKQHRILGSQRAMQFGGPPVFKHNARLYNCTSSYCDRLRFFPECYYLLLCGAGTGFSVQHQHIAKLPKFTEARRKKKKKIRKPYLIPDSIEGWSDALGVLLSSYFERPLPEFAEYNDTEVDFDFTQIRTEGSPLSYGIGTAPGPEPLAKALEKIRSLLERCISFGQESLLSIDAYDIVMHASDSVISGGVRRSATICLFSVDDELMATAKTGTWRYTDPQRGRSNNSAVLLRSSTSYEDFRKLMDHSRSFGEPGLLWTDDLDLLINPCGEAAFWAYLRVHHDSLLAQKYIRDGNIPNYNPDGTVDLSGWQFCNLTTQNGKLIKSKKDFFESAEAAAFVGVLQKGFNQFPYLGAISEGIVSREALLGVSITGIMENPKVLLDPESLREAAGIVNATDDYWAPKLGLSISPRNTLLKPEGNGSCVLGTLSASNAHHSKRYFRIVQANRNEAPYKFFKQHNYAACERSTWSANDTDDVIRFCVETEGDVIYKSQLGAVDMLNIVKVLYENWVQPGRRPEYATQPWLTHNISNTITVKHNEWESAFEYIYNNRQYFAGITLISDYGDKDFYQAPFTAVYTMEELYKTYGEAAVRFGGRIVQCALDNFANLWEACDLILNKWPADKTVSNKQHRWACDVHTYAGLYHDRSRKRTTNCLKDIFNARLWQKLQFYYIPVDYTKMIEKVNTTNLKEESACAGGVCEISHL